MDSSSIPLGDDLLDISSRAYGRNDRGRSCEQFLLRGVPAFLFTTLKRPASREFRCFFVVTVKAESAESFKPAFPSAFNDGDYVISFPVSNRVVGLVFLGPDLFAILLDGIPTADGADAPIP
jgi:hypothetical protein